MKKGIESEGLEVGYNSPLLSGLSFSVAPGETVALVGKSGCGKSTLLKTLAGIVHPRGGEARVNGVLLPARPDRGSLGYIPQDLGLIQNATVLRNVKLGMASRLGPKTLTGIFPDDCIDRAKDALAAVGLAGKEYTTPRELSGGERRRVAIARALVQAPRILLADEILSELDPVSAEEVLGALKTLQERHGTAILLVEHNMELACKVADRVLGLGYGIIAATFESDQKRPDCLREVLYGS